MHGPVTQFYIGKEKSLPGLQRQFILDYFGRPIKVAQKGYEEFVSQLVEKDYESPLKAPKKVGKTDGGVLPTIRGMRDSNQHRIKPFQWCGVFPQLQDVSAIFVRTLEKGSRFGSKAVPARPGALYCCPHWVDPCSPHCCPADYNENGKDGKDPLKNEKVTRYSLLTQFQ
jgi:hypothetical protein